MRFRRPNGKQGKLTLGRVDLSAKGSPDEPAIGMPLTLAAARRLAFGIQHERATEKDAFVTARRAKLCGPHGRRMLLTAGRNRLYRAACQSQDPDLARQGQDPGPTP